MLTTPICSSEFVIPKPYHRIFDPNYLYALMLQMELEIRRQVVRHYKCRTAAGAVCWSGLQIPTSGDYVHCNKIYNFTEKTYETI